MNQQQIQMVKNADGAQALSQTSSATLLPPVDVIEDQAGITLFADLPGVTKDKLNLQLEADSLIIEGGFELNAPTDMEANYTEVQLPRYRRVFTLSKELDGDKTTAEFKNGVLKLRIPKTTHAQPRKIEVLAL